MQFLLIRSSRGRDPESPPPRVIRIWNSVSEYRCRFVWFQDSVSEFLVRLIWFFGVSF